MKKCKYCMSDIDVNAKICPNCGKKQNSHTNLILIVVALLFVGGIIASVRNDANNVSYEIDKIRTSAEKGLETKNDLELEEDTKGSSDSYGISYYIEGYVKNNSSNNYNYVQITFTTYDKEGNTIGTCLDNNSGLEPGGRWKFKAICLDDVKNITSYKLKEISRW